MFNSQKINNAPNPILEFYRNNSFEARELLKSLNMPRNYWGTHYMPNHINHARKVLEKLVNVYD